MSNLTMYPAFIGTVLSVVLLTWLVYKEHDAEQPRTLSKLAARNKQLIKWFKLVLWVCGTLFAITMYFFVIPRVRSSDALFVTWTIYYVGELLLALFPARGGVEEQLHNFFAYAMSVAMLITTLLFTTNLTGAYQITEGVILGVTGVLALLTFIDRKRHVFYELPFIYLSHISIVVAVIAIK